MDAAKREELERRREALKARAAEAEHRKVGGHIIPALRGRGVPHRMVKHGETPRWLPHYLPTTFIRIYWEGAPAPAECEVCEDRAERAAVVARMLGDRAEPEAVLLFVYDGAGDSVMIRHSDAVPALDVLLDTMSTIWITSPPQRWLIESDGHLVRLALPPAVSDEELERTQARRAALIAPFAGALDAGEVPYRTYDHGDLEAPTLPDSISSGGRVDWQRIKRSFQSAVPRGDVAALGEKLAAYLDARCAPRTWIALHLFHGDAPTIAIQAGDLMRHLEPLMAAADRWDEDAPGGWIDVRGVRLFPVKGDWIVDVYVERANWRIRAAG